MFALSLDERAFPSLRRCPRRALDYCADAVHRHAQTMPGPALDGLLVQGLCRRDAIAAAANSSNTDCPAWPAAAADECSVCPYALDSPAADGGRPDDESLLWLGMFEALVDRGLLDRQEELAALEALKCEAGGRSDGAADGVGDRRPCAGSAALVHREGRACVHCGGPVPGCMRRECRMRADGGAATGDVGHRRSRL